MRVESTARVPLPAWYLDELAHAGPEHLDPTYVAGYDRKARVDPTDDLAHLRSLGLGPTSTVVDVGAGTGAFALAAAPLCRRVVAVDISPAMLSAVGREAAARDLTNLTCVQAGFLSYAHTGEPADFVYSRHALHQLPDFWKTLALTHIGSMLRVGGVLRVRDLFLSCAAGDAPHVIEAWLQGAAERSDQGWTRAELETHLRDEYSTFTWLFEPMLVQAGFEIKDATYADSRLYAAYTCVRVR
ncbi:MAG: class I SAM-dependent methyltransferase [Chloroflexi bacterium]|nr:class I SAM-dependent methyltransferase [Chloroflexota bacterium]